MARSADLAPRALRPAAPALGALLAGVALSACSTTMQEAARLQLNSARIRAAEQPTRVRVAGSAVRPTAVATISAGGRIAFVVRARNVSSRAVSDLPISVGVRSGRRRVYLNTSSPLEFSYFDSHLPVIAAGTTITWVYIAAARRLPPHARPFALIGAAPSPVQSAPARLPVIDASPAVASRPTEPLVIRLRNRSSIPQYQLQVYAVARRAGRYVAAASLTIVHLGSQGEQTARLRLVGTAPGAQLQVLALPTVLQ